MALHEPAAKTRWPRRVRGALELAVALVIMVTLFRSFLAGGYMIETGSMAPCLVGHHRRAVCPSCQYSFAVEGSSSRVAAACPNCGTPGQSTSGLVAHDGDHLLVHRGAFEFRPPRRWEVVVFKNPNRLAQVFVKRVVALPGETVRIVDGDLEIDGRIAAKPYQTQRGMRILVHDHGMRPPDDDPDWQPRWRVEKEGSRWLADGAAFRFLPEEHSAPSSFEPDLEWVYYRHWVRSGGRHKTSVKLESWPPELATPQSGFGQLEFDKPSGLLICRGALPAQERDRLLAQSSDKAFRQAVRLLFEASHVAPISDAYGYNRGLDGTGRSEVRDLMFEATVSLRGHRGEFVVAISDGAARFDCTFDLEAGSLNLREASSGNVVRTASLPKAVSQKSAVVEVSLMDRQFLLAIDGVLPFEPYVYEPPAKPAATPWRPVMFAARGLIAQVADLRLYRDVYYTAPPGGRGAAQAARLGAHHYFALGDNSPVSKDSRSWPAGRELTEDLLLGKPLVVHLPTRRVRARLAGWQTDFRIPEPSRIRYIR
jgi:signal peptidase I